MVNADFMSQLGQGRGGSRFGAWGSAPDPSENGSPVLCRVEHTRRGVIGQGRPANGPASSIELAETSQLTGFESRFLQ